MPIIKTAKFYSALASNIVVFIVFLVIIYRSVGPSRVKLSGVKSVPDDLSFIFIAISSSVECQ